MFPNYNNNTPIDILLDNSYARTPPINDMMNIIIQFTFELNFLKNKSLIHRWVNILS